MLQLNVEFALENDEFKAQLESETDKAIIPPESLVTSCYIIGCVFERIAKKERNIKFHNYKIRFEYAGDGIKDLVFTIEEILCIATVQGCHTAKKFHRMWKLKLTQIK